LTTKYPSRARDTALGCVHQYPDGRLAIFDGPRCLARFDPKGRTNDAVSQA